MFLKAQKILFLISAHILFCTSFLYALDSNKVITSPNYILKISNKTGSIESFIRNGRELIFQSKEPGNLFQFRFRDEKGSAIDISSADAQKISVKQSKNDTAYVIEVNFERIKNLPVNASATITCPFKSSLTYWNLTLDNQTNYSIDHIDFPNIYVPGDLTSTGGDSKIFRPSMEGVIIEDLSIREKNWLNAVPLEYPNSGWMGYYPASCAMQFWAYYNPKGGLYFAAHDDNMLYKGFDLYKQKNGSILLKVRLFPGGIKKGIYKMSYDMVIGGFDGDWYAAADIYRNWLEKSKMPYGPKVINNKRLPDWFSQSPVIVTYPVRGIKDTGEMNPNEYYPYTNGLPVINSISQKLDSKILALLMHWEGSAPWAPPYVWPPYGSLENFNQFASELHSKGNLIGLYASGTGYTIRSNTDTTYNRRKEFQDKNLKSVMTIAPDGSLASNGICVGDWAQRSGYDMCPSQPFVKQVIKSEVRKILQNGIDYVQYFDQNIGGNCYMCYSKTHNHVPAPGKWQNEAMVDIYKSLQQMVDSSGHKMLIGCEGSAAEPFQPYLLFNDLRYNLNYLQGKPVPAYAYLYHEYLSNFMGNQVVVDAGIDLDKSPLNMHQRIAHAFTAGDFLTVILAEKGMASWGWGIPWYKSKPDQESLFTLIKNLNAWRKGNAKDYLLYGKMIIPFEVQGTYSIPMTAPNRSETQYASLFTTAWINPSGSRMQIIANYTKEAQNTSLIMKAKPGTKVKVYNSYKEQSKEIAVTEKGKLELKVNALDAMMIEY
jgi:hypothetical protein